MRSDDSVSPGSRRANTTCARRSRPSRPEPCTCASAREARRRSTIVLGLANLKEALTVGTGSAEVSTAATNNLSAIVVDQNMLAGLPILDQDFVATLSRFLDAGSLGGGGPTLVVNGMEVSALRVSSSAIQQIKINQDPYSAEYGRPGRGRIEILTKPGTQQFHGEVNLTGRDGRLDSRNAFATTNTDERKRVYDGVLSGPVGSSGKTSFVLSGNYQTDDQQGVVYAAGPSGTIQDVVPQPNAQGLVSVSFTHQYGDATIISVTPSYEYEASDNRGVGGTTLASAGTNFRHHEQQVRYTQQTALSPHARESVSDSRRSRARAHHQRLRSARHRRRRRVHRRRRASRPRAHGNAHADDREPHLVARTPDHPGGVPAAGLESPRILRPDEFRRHLLLQQPGRVLGGASVRVHAAARKRRSRAARKASGRVHQGRLAGQARPVAVRRPAVRLAELLPRRQQLSVRARRSPMRRTNPSGSSFVAGSVSSAIGAAPSSSRSCCIPNAAICNGT